MTQLPKPTRRELEILTILWDHGEATVRTVFEEMSRTAPIVQNTVQAFLRTMESKGLVRHRLEGRAFIYVPVIKRGQAGKKMMKQALNSVFDGAIDQLVQSAFSVRQPTEDELDRLEEMIRKARNDK